MSLIIGKSGMVGQAIERALQGRPERLGEVYMCAGKVGGIKANIERPVEFLRENLAIYETYTRAEHLRGRKVLFFGSSCMYPRDCHQPMKESDLWSGPLEPTNEAYAVAKLAGEALVRAYRKQFDCRFITAIPCNIYGPGDHYEPDRAHVIPALIRRFIEAKRDGLPEVRLMGTGTARREFLHVDDLAQAALFLMENYDEDAPINVGASQDGTIEELACLIAMIVDYPGRIVFTGEGPDGMPRKLLDSSRIRAMGWEPKIGLAEGLKRTIKEVRI